MKSFSERRTLPIAIIGLVLTGLVFALVFNYNRLPVVGGGKTYTAVFAESAGLKTGNEVRVAGVRVGEVTAIVLDRDTVRVSFRVKDAWVGDNSTAEIKIKTLLGQKYLAVDPQGDKALDPDDAIALDHTKTPYDVTEAFSDLSTTITSLDTDQLAKSFRVLSATFANTPAALRGTIDGLGRLSDTISSRDTELAQLLQNTATLSGTLAERRDDVGALVTDGRDLLDTLAARRAAVRQLLIGTQKLSVQLSGLVQDNSQRLQPALDNLDRVTTILQRNQDDLRTSLKLLAPYYRLLAASLGNGNWVDGYVCGLFDPQGEPQLDSDAVRDCTPGKGAAQ